MINKLSSAKILTISSITILLFGIGALLFPVFDGWGEIFIPGTSNWFLVEIFLTGIALTVIIFHIIYLTITLFHRRSIQDLIYVLPIVILIGIWYLLYPSGVTRTNRRVDSFQLGARTRVMWAGGSSKIREDAHTLITTMSTTQPAPSEWPDSISNLGASYVNIDPTTQTVEVQIPRRHTFYADQFGYIILDKNASEAVKKNLLENFGIRTWKIADGIYLYEK